MRSAKLFALMGAASMASATTIVSEGGITITSVSTPGSSSVSIPVVPPSTTESSGTSSKSDTSVTKSFGFPNATSKATNLVKQYFGSHRNAEYHDDTPSEVTGGAIPQQMQHSMAGLIGFCIVGLIML
ncbi:hypothetical protein PT974_02553 [Cladobotryum mycophilum]|uniref:Uncharacterized protein n=1 Tax=Cladobotryum mycophilum TaxID=491253 RepID=A0ABR0SZM4_9HYPO